MRSNGVSVDSYVMWDLDFACKRRLMGHDSSFAAKSSIIREDLFLMTNVHRNIQSAVNSLIKH